MLRLADSWIWDFWFADDGRAFHVFFLQAPRTLGDPELRHVNVAVGHATSFRTWHSLCAEQGLTDHEAVELMTGMVLAAQRRAPASRNGE